MPIFIPIIALGAVAILSALLCRWLIAVAPKDAPDGARKTQTQAVPTSGGVAIFAAVAFSFAGILLLDRASPRDHFGALLTPDFLPYAMLCAAVLVIGALDDRKPIPTKMRLFGVFGLSLLAATLSPVFDLVFFPLADSIMPLPTWFAIGGTALWIFVMMNAVNFMDGSNGMAMGLLAIMIGTASVRLFGVTDFGPALFVFAAIIVAALVGFLFWNLQGRLYAGDAGSLFGGAVFATLAVFTARDGNIWFAATLALPILVDVFMTLIWRARQGHNILTPHRHHAYQLAIKAGWSHVQVALAWWGFALICGACALLAAQDSKAMSAWSFLGLLAIGCGLWLAQRRMLPGIKD